MWNRSCQCPVGHGALPWRRWPQGRCTVIDEASLSWHLAIRLDSHGLEELTRAHKILCPFKSAGKGICPIRVWKSSLLSNNSFIWQIHAVLIIDLGLQGFWIYKTWSLSSGYLLIISTSDNRRVQNCCLLPENNKENCLCGVRALQGRTGEGWPQI